MWRTISLLAVGGLVAGCASTPSPTPPATPDVVRAVDVDGEFTLTFEIPTAIWKAGEPITGEARLSVDTGSGTIYASAGGPLKFAYRE